MLGKACPKCSALLKSCGYLEANQKAPKSTMALAAKMMGRQWQRKLTVAKRAVDVVTIAASHDAKPNRYYYKKLRPCGISAGVSSPVIRFRNMSSSATICRNRMSAKSCAENYARHRIERPAVLVSDETRALDSIASARIEQHQAATTSTLLAAGAAIRRDMRDGGELWRAALIPRLARTGARHLLHQLAEANVPDLAIGMRITVT
jgi:hypothetical protein